MSLVSYFPSNFQNLMFIEITRFLIASETRDPYRIFVLVANFGILQYFTILSLIFESHLKIFLKSPCNLFMKYLWNPYEIYMESLGNLYENPMKSLWNRYEIFFEISMRYEWNLWNLFGIILESFYNLPEILLNVSNHFINFLESQ